MNEISGIYPNQCNGKSIIIIIFFFENCRQLSLAIRAVHESVRVKFVSNPEPIRRNRVGKKGTHR